jgi:hypothetical protein
VEFIEEAQGAEVKPICFVDGSLVIPFVQHMGSAL